MTLRRALISVGIVVVAAVILHGCNNVLFSRSKALPSEVQSSTQTPPANCNYVLNGFCYYIPDGATVIMSSGQLVVDGHLASPTGPAVLLKQDGTPQKDGTNDDND